MSLYDIFSYFLFGALSVSVSIIIFFCLQFISHCALIFIMSATVESCAPKRLTAGCRVSGTFRELIPNPNPAKRRCVRKQLFGNVIYAVGHGKYKVAFDDGVTLECFSNWPRAETLSTSIPLDVLPPQADIATANVPPRPQADIEQEADAVIEYTEDSHLEEKHMILRDKCLASYLLQQPRLKRCEHTLSERREQRSTFVSSWGQRWRFINEIKLSNGVLLQNLLWMLKRKKKKLWD
jgi:hypothetical protein